MRVVLYICLKKTNFSERFLFMPQYGAFNCYQNVLLNIDLLIPPPVLFLGQRAFQTSRLKEDNVIGFSLIGMAPHSEKSSEKSPCHQHTLFSDVSGQTWASPVWDKLMYISSWFQLRLKIPTIIRMGFWYGNSQGFTSDGDQGSLKSSVQLECELPEADGIGR